MQHILQQSTPVKKVKKNNNDNNNKGLFLKFVPPPKLELLQIEIYDNFNTISE